MDPTAENSEGRNFSSYHAAVGGELRCVRPAGAASPLLETLHEGLRSLVLGKHFPCVGARSALERGDYRIGLYPPVASPGATAGLAADLHAFIGEFAVAGDRFSSFLACFHGPVAPTEAAFEALLWRQLQALHDRDAAQHAWDPSVSPDPEDPSFSFSFGGRAFFVVGLHAAASRWSRRFAWPTLVFNAHAQFDLLRKAGKLERMKERVRARDMRLQGSINPALADFGLVSEARQYSGRAVPAAWKCPFRASR